MPVYEDAAAARILFAELAAAVGTARIIVVDDGSLIEPLSPDALVAAGLSGAVIKLRRNLGHQAAIAVGLCYVQECITDYDWVVVMDSDGEDSPQSLTDLLADFKTSPAQVRVAERQNRTESVRFRMCYAVYKLLFRLLTGKTINFGNYIALKPGAVGRLTAMNEIWLHLAGAVISARLPLEGRKIDRGHRYSGQSRMNFISLALHGFRGVMVFSEQVLIRMGGASLMVAGVSFLVIIAAVLMKLIDAASPGWLSTIVGSMVLIFLQTAVLTLITLMITGMVRTSSFNRIDYKAFIDHITPVSKAADAAV